MVCEVKKAWRKWGLLDCSFMLMNDRSTRCVWCRKELVR